MVLIFGGWWFREESSERGGREKRRGEDRERERIGENQRGLVSDQREQADRGTAEAPAPGIYILAGRAVCGFVCF
ncbi:MAG: hypothetical protein EBR30_30490, partial [Cytophagia bacterium]|nr:hypothetical protein [Cytophagia bacterium]